MKTKGSDITGNPQDQNPNSPEFSKESQSTELLLKKKRLNKQEIIDHLAGLTQYKLQGLIDYLADEEISENLDSNKIQNHVVTYLIEQILLKKAKERLDLNSMRFIMKAFRINPNITISYRKHVGLTLLMLACKSERNLDLLTAFVNEFKGDVNAISDKGKYRGYSVFSYCCFAENLSGLEFLIEADASPNKGSICPLSLSLTNNYTRITECLLNTTMIEMIDVNRITGGSAPIHLAAEHADVRTVARLINLGADADAVSERGLTPLHTALLNPVKNSTDICRYLLLVSQVDINVVYKGETPLFLSARLGNCEALKIIYPNVENPDAPMRSGRYKGHTPLSIAIVEGNVAVVLWLLQASSVNFLSTVTPEGIRQTTLIELAVICLKNDSSLDQVRIYQALKTHWINTHPEQVRTHIAQLIKKNDVDRLEDWQTFIVSEQSVDPETGNTPVHLACLYGQTATLTLLVDPKKMGMSPSSANNTGNAPLHILCSKRRTAQLGVFLNYVDDLNPQNNEHNTPLDIAFRKKDEGCLRLLITRGALMSEAIPSVETALEGEHYALARILLESIEPEKESERLYNLLQKLVGRTDNGLFVFIAEKLLSLTSLHSQLLRIVVTNDNAEIARSIVSSYEKRYGTASLSALINDVIDTESDNTFMHEACLKGNTNLIVVLFESGGNLLKENKVHATPLSLIKSKKVGCLLEDKLKASIEADRIVTRSKPKHRNPPGLSENQKRTAEIQDKITARQALSAKEKTAPKANPAPKPKSAPKAIAAPKKVTSSPKVLPPTKIKTVLKAVTPPKVSMTPKANTTRTSTATTGISVITANQFPALRTIAAGSVTTIASHEPLVTTVSPKPPIRTASPEAPVAMANSEPPVKATCLEASVAMTSSELTVTAPAPGPPVALPFPESPIRVASPEPAKTIPTHELAVTLPLPESPIRVTSPEPAETISTLELAVTLPLPESPMRVLSPEPIRTILTPELAVTLPFPASPVRMASPEPDELPSPELTEKIETASRVNLPSQEPSLPYETELSPQAFKLTEPLVENAMNRPSPSLNRENVTPSLGSILSSSLTKCLSQAHQKGSLSSISIQELSASSSFPHPDAEIHLMGLTLYIECKLKDIEDSSPETIMGLLKLLANCLDDLENYVMHSLISHHSPLVNFTRQLSSAIQKNDSLDFKTCSEFKKTAIKIYSDIVEQSGRFQLNDFASFVTCNLKLYGD